LVADVIGTRDSGTDPRAGNRDEPGVESRDTARAGTRDSAGAGSRGQTGSRDRMRVGTPGRSGSRDKPGVGTRDTARAGTRDSAGAGSRDKPGHDASRDSGTQQESGQTGSRESGHSASRDSGQRGRRESGQNASRDSGTNRESGVGTQRESGLVTRRDSGLRDAAGLGTVLLRLRDKRGGRKNGWSSKKKCVMEGAFAQGGGPAESHREYYVGDAACEGGAGEPPHGTFGTGWENDPWEGVPTGSWEIGGGNGEMDEGSEGRSGVTVGGQQLCEVRIRGNPRFV
jgi:hypothetical protein